MYNIPHEFDELFGVYSTQELAEQAQERACMPYPVMLKDGYKTTRHRDENSFTIEVITLDQDEF